MLVNIVMTDCLFRLFLRFMFTRRLVSTSIIIHFIYLRIFVDKALHSDKAGLGHAQNKQHQLCTLLCLLRTVYARLYFDKKQSLLIN